MLRQFIVEAILPVLIMVWMSEAPAQTTRKPYLQVVTPTSIVVRWDTATPETSTVHYGPSDTMLVNNVSDTGKVTKHEITLRGLAPKTRYSYSVVGPNGGRPDQYFVTAPPTGTAQSTRIWVVSDFGQSNTTSHNTRRTQTVGVWKGFNNNDVHADLVLSLGDQTEDDTDTQLTENFFNQIQDVVVNTPMYTIPGNHEDHDSEITYKAVFSSPANAEAGGVPSGSEDYYSFDYGNVHVVALTVENGVPITGSQTEWLRQDLAKNRSDWLIAMMHRPMHSAGYHPTDASETASLQKKTWLPLLEAAGVDLILSGHNHCYERSYMTDNLIGLSTSITAANKIDTGLGRVDSGGAYRKKPFMPHQGTIFISCQAAGTSNKASYLPVPYSFFPVVFKEDVHEGSLVIDVRGKDSMDVTFLCDQFDYRFSHIWDYFTIIKSDRPTSTGDNPSGVPSAISVANYPNPFNPETVVIYQLPGVHDVKVTVYDLLGREVAVLAEGRQEGGNHKVQFDGTGLAGGMYVCRLAAEPSPARNGLSGKFVTSTKMLLVR